MDAAECVYVVDRIENDLAVLVAEEADASVDVPRARLPGKIAEGDVLRVPVTFEGVPHWERSALDPELRVRRLAEAHAVLRRLRKRDPGGDIVL